MYRKFIYLYLFLLCCCSITLFCAPIQEKPQVFSTTEIFEVDKCASIWLIKRFINPGAEILFFPEDSTPDRGIAFDTPNATFRRYANISTFQYFLNYYKLEDPRLIYLGHLIYDIEINTWGKKRFPETRQLEEAIMGIIFKAQNTSQLVADSCAYFDQFFAQLE